MIDHTQFSKALLAFWHPRKAAFIELTREDAKRRCGNALEECRMFMAQKGFCHVEAASGGSIYSLTPKGQALATEIMKHREKVTA